MELDIQTVIAAATVVGSLGAAWGGSRVALNGTRERVKKLAADFEQHTAQDASAQLQAVQRLVSVETKVDLILEEVRK